MPSKPYIFISHSSTDSEFTVYLASRLLEAGYTPWIDVESIPDGSSWLREIQKAVEGCGAMIVVMSKAAGESEWVERETLLAMDLRKPLFVALIENVAMPLHLINRQYTDFRKKRDTAMNRLLTALKAVSLTEPAPEPRPTEAARLSPNPNEHNFFKFLEQLPNGRTCASVARSLHEWAREHVDAVTFSGRAHPAFHTHIWLGPGGILLFSVRAYPQQPAVEVQMQYLKDFPPFEARAERLALLDQFNRLMPPDEQFTEDRADKRPNLPLVSALAPDAHLDAFKHLMSDVIERLRAENT